MIAELQTNAPDVYRLFMTLGATSSNVQSKDDGIIPEEIRAHCHFHSSEGTICKGEGYTTYAKLYADIAVVEVASGEGHAQTALINVRNDVSVELSSYICSHTDSSCPSCWLM